MFQKAQFEVLHANLMAKKKEESEKLEAIKAEKREWFYNLTGLLSVESPSQWVSKDADDYL